MRCWRAGCTSEAATIRPERPDCPASVGFFYLSGCHQRRVSDQYRQATAEEIYWRQATDIFVHTLTKNQTVLMSFTVPVRHFPC
jgi:hypothetical protein